MTQQDENDLAPIGAGGLEIKRRIADQKSDQKSEDLDVGASSLGTDNEAGAMPDADGMAQARKAPQP